MAERGRRRPAGSPSGREPGRTARARDARARSSAGRSQASRTRSTTRGGSSADRVATKQGATKQDSGQAAARAASSARKPGRAEGATTAAGRVGQRWETFAERFHGGEGMSPRRVVIVIVMVCFLSLALASPVRTYFTQHSEAAEAAAHHEELVAQISELKKQEQQLENPDYIRAKARDRLGFVEAGKTPYIVELPGNPERAKADHDSAKAAGQPWYSTVWDSVSQEPAADDVPVPNVIPGPGPAPASGGE